MLYNLKTSIHPPIVYSRLQNFRALHIPTAESLPNIRCFYGRLLVVWGE